MKPLLVLFHIFFSLRIVNLVSSTQFSPRSNDLTKSGLLETDEIPETDLSSDSLFSSDEKSGINQEKEKDQQYINEETQEEQENDSISKESFDLFPHGVGFNNQAMNCYASSVISSLYFNPLVHEALYSNVNNNIDDPTMNTHQSVTAALAAIFYKMRFEKKTLNFNFTFAPAARTKMDWKFGRMECVLEFWTRMSMTLPIEFNELFHVKTTQSHYRRADRKLIISKRHSNNIIFVSPKAEFETIESMIQNDFIDNNAEDFVIKPFEQDEYGHIIGDRLIMTSENIPSFTKFKIINKPKCLVFGIKRVDWDAQKNTPVINETLLRFPEILNVNDAEYTRIGNVEFNVLKSHYISQNLDILTEQWYMHDDDKVEKLSDSLEDFEKFNQRFSKNSCIVFYIRNDLKEEYFEDDLSRLSIPKQVISKLKAESNYESQLLSNPERKRKEKNYYDEPLSKKAKSTDDDIEFNEEYESSGFSLDPVEPNFSNEVTQNSEFVDLTLVEDFSKQPLQDDSDSDKLFSDAVDSESIANFIEATEEVSEPLTIHVVFESVTDETACEANETANGPFEITNEADETTSEAIETVNDADEIIIEADETAGYESDRIATEIEESKNNESLTSSSSEYEDDHSKLTTAINNNFTYNNENTLSPNSSKVIDEEVEVEVEKDEDEDEDEDDYSELFPHRVGIGKHDVSCYASSIIASLYTIPMVHEILHSHILKNIDDPTMNKNESLTTALAAIFYKMRYENDLIDLEPFFVPLAERFMEWKFGRIECVLEFWAKITSVLPEEFNDLFKIEITESHYRKSDNTLIDSKNYESNIFLIPQNGNYSNIEIMIENDFYSHHGVNSSIESSETSESIPSFTSTRITNNPKCLIFGIKRVHWDETSGSRKVNEAYLGFPEYLTLNWEEYTCVSSIEFNIFKSHFISKNMDILTEQWYVHNDSNVEKLFESFGGFESFSHYSELQRSMVFYIRNDIKDLYLLSRPKIPLQIRDKLLNNFNVVDEGRKRDREDDSGKEDKDESCLKKVRNDHSDEIDDQSPDIIQAEDPQVREFESNNQEIKVNELIQNEETSFSESVKFGSESSSSFKLFRPKIIYKCPQIINDPQVDQPPSDSNNSETNEEDEKDEETNQIESELNSEIVIFISDLFFNPIPVEEEESSSASEIAADTRLGQIHCSFADGPRNIFLEHILMALSLNPTVVRILFEEVKDKPASDILFKITQVILKILLGLRDVSTASLSKELEENYNFKFDNIYKVWTGLTRFLPNKISPIPNFKMVQLRNDEPIQIFEEPNCCNILMKPSLCIPCPFKLNLNGVFFDSKCRTGPEMKRRSIFKSDGLIIPLGIERLIINNGKATFDDAQIYTRCFDKYETCFIGFDPVNKYHYSVHLNLIYKTLVFFKGKENPETFDCTPEITEYVQHGIKHHSILILFSSAEDYKQQMPLFSEIPANLLNESDTNA